MQIGIIGLLSSGKTAFFNALTGQEASTGDYALSKEANMAVVKVPDPRLNRLAEIFKPKRIVHAEVQYVDIAGMTGGKSSEKKEAAYVANLRNVDALAQVVRVFQDQNIPHPDGSINPVRDINNVNSELLFYDLLLIDNNIQKLEKKLRVSRDDDAQKMLSLFEKYKGALESETFLADLELSDSELKTISGFGFLTLKPQLYILNISEEDLGSYSITDDIKSAMKPESKSSAVSLCAEIAMEISRLDEEDKKEFRESLGIEKPALETVIQKSYHLLGVISFLTGSDTEVHAWTVKQGAKAPQAAGAVHTDFEKGFIKAEVIQFEELDKLGSWSEAKSKGKLRLEGKEYVVKDGDVILFRFNV